MFSRQLINSQSAQKIPQKSNVFLCISNAQLDTETKKKKKKQNTSLQNLLLILVTNGIKQNLGLECARIPETWWLSLQLMVFLLKCLCMEELPCFFTLLPCMIIPCKIT